MLFSLLPFEREREATATTPHSCAIDRSPMWHCYTKSRTFALGTKLYIIIIIIYTDYVCIRVYILDICTHFLCRGANELDLPKLCGYYMGRS